MNSELTLIETFQKLGIALGLGLLVGMQRERTQPRIAGIRTFSLATLLGTIAGLLSLQFGGWVLASGLASLAALVIIGNLEKSEAPPDPGLTTEVAMLLMFADGAYLVLGYTPVAVALSGTIAVLLHFKPELHAFVQKMGDKDFKAVIQFVLITLVILPVLPNQEFGPYKVLNPFRIWLQVVLIVGMRLAGYVAYKFVGAQAGSLLSGLFGGLISSTATTVSYARRAREDPQNSSMAALVIMVASAVVFVRILVISAIVASSLLPGIFGPLGAMLGVMALITAGFWLFTRKQTATVPEQENPSELKPALIFAVVFALVQLVVAVARQYFGARGLYAVAFLSGLPDLDAITLSTLQIGKGNQLDVNMVWRMILIAALANLLFKTVMAGMMGSRKLLAQIAGPFGLAFAAGGLLLWLWP
ncbi:MAG: rane protein [Pedosphaera sp.]|nr:rane protein [Pedosphaera sp.]